MPADHRSIAGLALQIQPPSYNDYPVGRKQISVREAGVPGAPGRLIVQAITVGVDLGNRSAKERRKPKTRYHHGNLRAALIECGLELIQRKGIHALTLREIGQRLGVSRSAAYRHFKDKAALLFAISEAGFIEFGNMMEASRKDAGDGFAAQMDAMALAYARFADEHRAQFEVMFAAITEARDLLVAAG